MNDAADQAAFELLLAREFEDPEYFAVHHLTVAAYRLQHLGWADDHSLAHHLSVMRAAIDGGLDGAKLRRHNIWAAQQLRADPPGPIPRPSAEARMRASDAAAAGDAAEHCALVRRWAAEVWEVWRPVADAVLPG